MKTSFYLTAFCLVSLSIFLLYAKMGNNTGSIAITASDTDNTYKFTASFDPNATPRVLYYINKSIEPTGSGDYFNVTSKRIDVTTRLNDQTEFYIKESPGELKVVLDKRKNSQTSALRIKRMCEGIKNLLAGKS
ncbi:MAG TPA: hypothetical protein VNW95_02480 [Mucilaginibacter sp.]|jgi:hypothetical protein|nr:hypothetical protein [Mucilaginibacter sp.]